MPLIRAIRVLTGVEADGSVNDTLIIDADTRRGLREQAVTNSGETVAFDLPHSFVLRTDDVLLLEDGRRIAIVAAVESLYEVRGDLALLARIAWALGDRHVPVQLLPNRLRLRADTALGRLIATLGGKIIAIEAPFDPEGGAYATPAHAHDHDHAHHDHHGHGHAGHTHD
jgi:urease accessory protein